MGRGRTAPAEYCGCDPVRLIGGDAMRLRERDDRCHGDARHRAWGPPRATAARHRARRCHGHAGDLRRHERRRTACATARSTSGRDPVIVLRGGDDRVIFGERGGDQDDVDGLRRRRQGLPDRGRGRRRRRLRDRRRAGLRPDGRQLRRRQVGRRADEAAPAGPATTSCSEPTSPIALRAAPAMT